MTATQFIIDDRLQSEDPAARLFMFGFRCMGANGLNDASAAHAFVIAFGKDFRRPLMLLRTLLVDLSVVSARPIQVAPWCCPRLTPSEGAMLDVVRHSIADERRAHLLLSDMIGVRDAARPLATATALASAFADLGLPLE